MKLVFLSSTFVIFILSCSGPAGNPDGPRNLNEARTAIVFEDMADRYFKLNEDLFLPAQDLKQPDHFRKANWALETLDLFQDTLKSRMRGKTLCREDQIDLALLDGMMASTRFNLESSVKEEQELAALLPAHDLDEFLPDLTGLIQNTDLQSGLESIRKASNVFNQRPTLPDKLILSMAQAASGRAKALRNRVNQWSERAENRFNGQTEGLKEISKTLAGQYRAYSEKMDDTVIKELEQKNESYGHPIGRDRFISLLKNRHMIYLSPEELRKFGQIQLELIQHQIDSMAAVIEPGNSSRDVWEHLKDEHPTKNDLPRYAYREMEKSLDLILKKGFISIPENARQNVMLVTEGKTYKTYPFGGYGDHELQGREYIGKFMTSPPKYDESEEASNMRLRGNNYYWARVVAVHEIYPGHHLQYVVRKEIDRPVRRNFHTTTLSEGWGLYSEDLMFRHGFFPDSKTEMALYMMQKWRAARIIVDVSLHLEWMTFDEAVDFMVEEVYMDRENALAEVRRYMGNATRPLSYLYGFRQLQKLYADAKSINGFDERKFHDTVLRMGAIPIKLIRAKILGEPVPGFDELKEKYQLN